MDLPYRRTLDFCQLKLGTPTQAIQFKASNPFAAVTILQARLKRAPKRVLREIRFR